MSFSPARGYLLLVIFGALAACAPPKPAVSTTTVTSAPWVPDQPFPAELLVETPEEVAAQKPIETWGVRPPTQQQLDEYGF